MSELVERVALAIWRMREKQFPERTQRKEPDGIDHATGAWQLIESFARAAIQAMQVRQPIATAPKDGTPIIGYSPEGVAYVCWAHGYHWVFLEYPNGNRWMFEPTEWLPLPAPPVEAKSEVGG
ncbi:hypothetical protein [Bradyrhizobium sp. Arg816]|uniref:hypothetical protein n=1 Tax=Bradyrhizobium sp. Arg816 TaxID=2998491 RepID=UPI00249EB909|nr:hypothetical protein [Bradyrhizobium sp. Arg816]MDI3563579.1 hypothetical protein [Bradyrhizobium sp. Arg816]